jgi:hypothetical protein
MLKSKVIVWTLLEQYFMYLIRDRNLNISSTLFTNEEF